MKVTRHRVRDYNPEKDVGDVINDPPKGYELHSVAWMHGGYNATTHGNYTDQFLVIWKPTKS